MKKIKRTAKKLQEEYEDIASGKRTVWGSYKKNLAKRKEAKIKAEEMKKFLSKEKDTNKWEEKFDIVKSEIYLEDKVAMKALEEIKEEFNKIQDIYIKREYNA